MNFVQLINSNNKQKMIGENQNCSPITRKPALRFQSKHV